MRRDENSAGMYQGARTCYNEICSPVRGRSCEATGRDDLLGCSVGEGECLSVFERDVVEWVGLIITDGP